VQREVPDKAHYHNKRWSEEVTELKNYNLYARYTADQYVVKVVTGIQGYTYRDTTVTYGQGITYQEIADALSYDDKYLIGLYSDASFANKINLNSVVDKDITLYAKWGNIVHLTSPSDWNEIVQNPAGRFVLENDISFKMETIPVVDNFSGILDGQGHAIQRFSNSNTGCSSNYGLFKTNTGTIKNLTIEDVSKVIRSISTMKGTEYYSNRHKKWETLYHEAYLVASPEDKTRIPDDTEGSADGKTLYCMQDDNSFGKCYYSLSYLQRENEVSVCFDNFESLKFAFITAAKPHNIKINLVVIDEGEYFLVYLIVQAYYPRVSFLEEKMIDSFNARVDSIYKWFVKEMGD
jgi:hypothetical protein